MKRETAIIMASTGALLVVSGIVMGSLTVRQAEPHALYHHLMSIGLGLLGAVGVNLLSYHRMRQWRWPVPKILVVVALVLLVLVLIPHVGTLRNGARRWLLFFQPSELAKLALLIGLADYCATKMEYMHLRRVGFTYPMLLGGLAVGLVFAEPDWGTAALMGFVVTAVLWAAGTPTFYLAASAIIGFELVVHFLIRNPAKLTRILVFLDPAKYAGSDGWQVWHSLLAIGSGGWLGRFIGDGLHKLGFVPEQRTDFIMSIVGEELGLVGTTFVVLMYLSIVLAGMRIVKRMADPFASFLALGITLLIGMQAVINIGVATSCLPNKGIPLPLVSYGGTSMVVTLTAIGLLVNIARNAPLLQVAELLPPETAPVMDTAPVVPAAAAVWSPKALATRTVGRVMAAFRRSRNPFESAPSARPWQKPPAVALRSFSAN